MELTGCSISEINRNSEAAVQVTMRRFPSKEVLAKLTPSDRAFMFQMEYEEIKEQITGIVSGYIKPKENETKDGLLSEARGRMSQLYKIAGEFNYNL